MRWPVSRLAYDAVCSERDRLREQNDKLVDSLTRLARVEHGLKEKPLEPRVQPEDNVPDPIRNLIRNFSSERVRVDQLERAKRAHADGSTWQEIGEEILQAIGAEVG